jgi:hypothetical protein
VISSLGCNIGVWRGSWPDGKNEADSDTPCVCQPHPRLTQNASEPSSLCVRFGQHPNNKRGRAAGRRTADDGGTVPGGAHRNAAGTTDACSSSGSVGRSVAEEATSSASRACLPAGLSPLHPPVANPLKVVCGGELSEQKCQRKLLNTQAHHNARSEAHTTDQQRLPMSA